MSLRLEYARTARNIRHRARVHPTMKLLCGILFVVSTVLCLIAVLPLALVACLLRAPKVER